MLRYDERELAERLQGLPNRLRVAFAAACAERQLPSYFRFAKATGRGSPERLVSALRCVWEDIEGRPTSLGELRGCLNTCMALLPEEAGDFGPTGNYAEDSVSAIVYTIEARLKSDVQEAIESARVAYASLDAYVTEMLNIQSIGKNEEAQIVAHPLVQAEFRRQRVDLLQLQEIAKNPGSERDGIAELRRRAQADARIFFGPEAK